MILPGTAALRRRLALGCLALGAVLASRGFSRDLPHEQTLIFRLGNAVGRPRLKLSATLLRVGESEPSAGFTIVHDGNASGDPVQKLRLPNGDYVVTVEWQENSGVAEPESTAKPRVMETKESETSLVERVTLTGGDTIVQLEKRVPK